MKNCGLKKRLTPVRVHVLQFVSRDSIDLPHHKCLLLVVNIADKFVEFTTECEYCVRRKQGMVRQFFAKRSKESGAV